MSDRRTIIIVTATLASVGTVLLWYKWQTIANQADFLYVTEGDYPPLRLLHKISHAITIVEADFMKVKKGLKHAAIDPAAKKVLAGVTDDIDFIFAELDQVRGGDFIKRKRKALAERLKCLSDEVDKILLERICGR
jgi:hypothetical protein